MTQKTPVLKRKPRMECVLHPGFVVAAHSVKSSIRSASSQSVHSVWVTPG